MVELTENEMKAVLMIFKDFNTRYNSNNLAKEIGLSAMGTLKILKKLHKQNILKVEEIGKSKIYSIDFNDYSKQFISFLLRKEAEEITGRVKRWVVELRKLKDTAIIGILAGSVLKTEKYNDVDILAALRQQQIKKFNERINEMNEINIKRIHPIKQAVKDLKNNLSKKDKVVLDIIKSGIVLFGYDEFVEVVKSVSR
jgi:DNA-binding Lrp family transcriptional regulator